MINNPVRKQLPTLENPGTAIDLRSGKSLIAPDGSVVTGTLPEVEQATPAISVSSGGLITTTAVQVGGIVADGTKSAKQQLDTQGETTITPGTAAKTAVAAGHYTTGDVIVAGDINLKADNIAEGVSIFGVAGNFAGSRLINCNVNFKNTFYGRITYLSQSSVITKGGTATTAFNNLKISSNTMFVIHYNYGGNYTQSKPLSYSGLSRAAYFEIDSEYNSKYRLDFFIARDEFTITATG